MLSLYGQNTDAQKAALGETSFSADEFADIGDIKGQGVAGEGFTNFDPGALGEGSNAAFRKFRRNLTDEQRMKIFGNQNYQAAFGQATAGMNAFSPTQTPEQVLIQSLRAKVNSGTATPAEIAQLNALVAGQN